MASIVQSVADRVAPPAIGGHQEPAYVFHGSDTILEIYLQGLGDRMIARQIGQAFNRYLEGADDPGLGRVILTCGGFGSSPVRGDLNLYWWWSLGPFDKRPKKWLPYYLERVRVPPDVILCPSERTLSEAQKAGFPVIYLPLGVGPEFRPLGLDRLGLGYAGTPGHKPDGEEDRVLGPFLDTDEFEWVSDINTPAALNLWYNRKMIAFGMTLPGQRRMGMVNNRVFEVLASGTPFVTSMHDQLEEILGFNYPYQTASANDTVEMVRHIQAHSSEVLAECRVWSQRIREEHSYTRRLEKLFGELG